jgi:hypothetical protein
MVVFAEGLVAPESLAVPEDGHVPSVGTRRGRRPDDEVGDGGIEVVDTRVDGLLLDRDAVRPEAAS